MGLARTVSDPRAQIRAHYYVVAVHLLRGEFTQALQHAEAAVGFATNQRFTYWTAVTSFLYAWALAGIGKLDEAISRMQDAFAAERKTGMLISFPGHLLVLAAALGKQGNAEKGLKVLEESFVLTGKGGRYMEAELYRVKGELLVIAGEKSGRLSDIEEEAESGIKRAVEVAREQQAKSLELRAITSLARLWSTSVNKRTDGLKSLSKIYAWFSEGFETGDLKEAKALIDTLTAKRAAGHV